MSDTAAPAAPRPLAHLAEALAAFQAEMPTVTKTHTAQVKSERGAYSYTYADLADVSEAAMPLLAKHGLSFTCLPSEQRLTGMLLHTSGEYVTASLPLTGANPQQVGSSLTYMRRYLLGCMTGVVTDDDDDGAAASTPRTKPRRTTRPGPVEPAGDAPPSAAAAPGPGLITDAQQRLMRRLLADYGMGGKEMRETVLALVSEVVGREVSTSSELTRKEAGEVITHLQAQLGELPDGAA